jgi:hypothetical protein
MNEYHIRSKNFNTADADELHVRRLRLRYLAGQIHEPDPRPLSELLTEIAEGADPFEAAERYARLNREHGDFIRANGGDRFASSPFSIPNLSVANGTH